MGTFRWKNSRQVPSEAPVVLVSQIRTLLLMATRPSSVLPRSLELQTSNCDVLNQLRPSTLWILNNVSRCMIFTRSDTEMPGNSMLSSQVAGAGDHGRLCTGTQTGRDYYAIPVEERCGELVKKCKCCGPSPLCINEGRLIGVSRCCVYCTAPNSRVLAFTSFFCSSSAHGQLSIQNQVQLSFPNHPILLNSGMISELGTVHSGELSSHLSQAHDRPVVEAPTHKPVGNGKAVPIMFPRVERIGWAQSIHLGIRAKLRQLERGTKIRSSVWNPSLTFFFFGNRDNMAPDC